MPPRSSLRNHQRPERAIDPEEASELLLEMRQNLVWREVIEPNARVRLGHIERRLARDRNLTLEEIHILQAEHKLWSDMLENPVQFFNRLGRP